MFQILAGLLTGPLIKAVGDIFLQYQAQQITREQLEEHLKEAILKTFSEVQQSYDKSMAEMYASFMAAIVQSKIMQVVWAIVVLSQLGVLVFAQVVVPAMVAAEWISRWPSAGATIDWAYYLLGGSLGIGPLVLRRKIEIPKV